MIQIDLTNPSHVNTLRWACGLSAEERAYIAGSASRNCVEKRACAALSSPEQSAAIVRALLEGCGVEAVVGTSPSVWCGPGPDPNPKRLPETIAVCVGDKTYWVPAEKVAALILRLLACTTREESLAALREAGDE